MPVGVGGLAEMRRVELSKGALMRKELLASLSIVMAAIATPALAEGAYFGIDGGVYAQRPLDYNFVGLSNFFSSKYSRGLDVSGKTGYDFEGLRIEGEFGYKKANTHQFGFVINGAPLLVQSGAGVRGNVNTYSAMVNGYWDITQTHVRPYIGAGVGAARVSSDNVGYSGAGPNGIFLNSSDFAFAFQLMAGLQARITRHLFTQVGYRYFDVEHVRLSAFSTVAAAPLHSHSVLFGISYHFGSSIRDTPPPPRPPNVSSFGTPGRSDASSSALPNVGLPQHDDEELHEASPQTTFSVSFASGAVTLSTLAQATLDQLVVSYSKVGHASVMVDGTTNGSLALYDDQLAQRRGAAVAAYLVSKAIAQNAIAVQSFEQPHEDWPGVGVSSFAPVTISFGPGSGQ